MAKKYLIMDTETGEYLTALYLGFPRTIPERTIPPLIWETDRNYAIAFVNADTAQITINFIAEIIDWNLKKQLEIAEVNTI